MPEYYVDERDIKFQLFEYLEIEKLLESEVYKQFSKEEFEMVIGEAIKFAKTALAPINKLGDDVGVKFDKGKVMMPDEFKAVYNKYVEAGWIGMSSKPEFGGQGFPQVVGTASAEIFVGSNVSFTMAPGLTRAAADLIEDFGTQEMKELYVPKMLSGEWCGTMCLTEPQAGSAVGDLSTAAKPTGKPGEYLISGTKIFITFGDHDLTPNIVHLALARIEGAPKGIKGVSLFLAPKYRVNADGSLGEFNDIACSGIEHKMGIHGSPTCTLNFGDNGKCLGYIIGEANQGIKYMFKMMNEARIGVGLQGQALASAAYQLALRYAHERIQGVDIREMKNVDAPRVPIVAHPDVRRMLLYQKAYVEGIRGLLYKTAFFGDLIKTNKAAGNVDEADKYQDLLDLFTPICKAYSSDYAFRCIELALQVYGGYGYSAEYGVEQYLRDSKIASIYEGANGIQALDLLGRKIAIKGGLLFMRYMTELNGFVDANKANPTFAKEFKVLEKARDILAETTMSFAQMSMSGNVLYPVLQAYPYLEMFGHVLVSNILLEQALVAAKKLDALFSAKGATTDEAKRALIKGHADAKFYSGKVETAKFFAHYVLPHVFAISETIKSNNTSALDIEFETF